MKLLLLLVIFDISCGDVSHVVNNYLPPDIVSTQSRTVTNIRQGGYSFGSNGNDGFIQKPYPSVTQSYSSQESYKAPVSQFTYTRPSLLQNNNRGAVATNVYTSPALQQTFTSKSQVSNGSPIIQKSYIAPKLQGTYVNPIKQSFTAPATKIEGSSYRSTAFQKSYPLQGYSNQKSYLAPDKPKVAYTSPVQKSYVAPATPTIQNTYTNPIVSSRPVSIQSTSSAVQKSYLPPNVQKSYSAVQNTVQKSYTPTVERTYTAPVTSNIATYHKTPITTLQKPYSSSSGTGQTNYKTRPIQSQYLAPAVQKTYGVPAPVIPTGYKGIGQQSYIGPKTSVAQNYLTPVQAPLLQSYNGPTQTAFGSGTRYDSNGGYVY